MNETMSRLTAALSDRYRLERELGQGGMATVYLAEDLKHKRHVALKVLKPELAAVLGADRFVQEITTTAALQHPHILPLFDSGTADGFLFYVMPFIDGETLRSKLDRETQLGIDEAVKITTAIADALDYAHRHGVIHRDIKPENILLHEGRPMVADFGIALAVSAAAGGRMTETGLSLGTPHYMSPEQATAEKEISARSDVYSLASVLYEMLTGNPPHTGASAQQIIMKIVTEQAAPVTTLRKTVPPNVAAAVAKALEKLPADRFESARAFGEALGNTAFTVAGTAASYAAAGVGSRGVSRHLFAGVAGFAVVLLAALTWSLLRPGPEPVVSRQQVVLWDAPFPQALAPGLERMATQAAIAPDGSSIVFVDSVGSGFQLMRKLRGEAVATPIPGTEGGLSPFFSPDGQWVGFMTTNRKLKKVPVAGGGTVTLAEESEQIYTAAAWLDDGTIIYTSAQAEWRRISAEGGESRVVPRTGIAERINAPTLWPLPGSRAFLFTACDGNCANGSDVYVHDLRDSTSRLLVSQAIGAWYVPSGYLLYGSREGGLYAMAFDLKSLAVSGGPIPVIDDVEPMGFTLSASGAVLYSPAASAAEPAELVWVSRDGSAESLDPTWRGRFEYPALSPDGRTLAVSVRELTTDLWVRGEEGTRQKLPAPGSVNWRPSWAPDGRGLAFSSNTRAGDGQDAYTLQFLQVGSGEAPSTLQEFEYGLWEVELAPDGEWLVLRADVEGGYSKLYARRRNGDTTMVPVFADQTNSSQAAISPDSRWLAYLSDATGQPEIYVASFPDLAARRLVSRGGGTEPRWARNGRELFFKSGGQFMVVDVTTGVTFTAGNPRALFPLAGFRGARNRQQYDVSPDGRRFVMIKDPASNMAREAVYVENWFTELQAKVKR